MLHIVPINVLINQLARHFELPDCVNIKGNVCVCVCEERYK